ncbi:energy transducer TonB [Pedobacter fastidiosus]|uniref:Energy transducer TonB n=1 Tax=Pedobacter fastidiosus TaxID=2765361 RepID=A0ABR7KY06_9SPHI|nr:energy transducer TonB [Pedobacter fastidiosus]MBC6112906.1 energy transducer TonB [Pedobacter fastidiosus]
MFNSSINVYKTEWLDLVFANRNKTYGAYELRSKSSTIMTRALFVSGSIFLLLCFSPIIYAKVFPKETVFENTTTVVDLQPIHDMNKKVEPEKKVEPAKAEPVKVKTVKMVSNIVVVDRKDIEEPPTIKDIESAVVSNKTQDGEIKPNLVIPTATGNGNGLGKDKEGVVGGVDNEIYIGGGVDEYPEFTGGMKAFTKYMERNLRYPSRAQEDEIQGKVFVSFVVEKDGSITDVQVLRGIGYGCDEEAMKVIKKSPLWKPGKNKGVPVRVRYNMPINFNLM